MARQFSTVIEFIQYGKVNSNTFGAGVIEFEGFNSIGDGGATLWQREGTTGLTPSKTPTEFDDNRFTDAVGDLWVLVPSQIVTFNGVQFLPIPFGAAGNGGYYFNGTDFVFLASAADEAAAAAASAAAAQVSAQRAEDAAASIEGQLTTTQLIASSLALDVGDTIQTNGFYTAGDGGGALWVKTANTDTPSQAPADMVDTTLTDGSGSVWGLVLNGEINVAKLGAGYGADDTSVFNLSTKKLRDSMTTALDFEYTTLTFVIPPKEYNVSSVDFTGFRGARNLNILAWGAVIKPIEAGKKIIDATGSRWLWLWGLTISSEDFESEAGIQLGNEGTETCGNNKFFGVQCLGKFSRAPIANYGSETTQYYSCRMANNSTNVDSYAYVGDGANSLGYSSDYVTVTRTSPQAVSFTNNKFYGCQMRHTGLGQPMYLSGFRDWDIDSACYLLSPQGHAITIWGSSTIRSLSLGLNGLMETTGLEGIINFISDGTTNTLEALRLKTPSPHVSGTIFKNSTGTTVNLLNSSIDINRQFNSSDSPVFFDSNIRLSGSIKTRYAAGLNLGDLIEFDGDLFCNDISEISSLPVSGGYSARDEEGVSISTGVKYVGLEAWELKSVDAGVITINQQLNTLNEVSSVDVTDLAMGDVQGYQEIYFRNGGATNITFKHSNSKLRNISGTDVTLSTHQSISYIRVSSTVWQQVGGKL